MQTTVLFRIIEEAAVEKIDFVLPWVDGGDPQWQTERKRYDADRAGAADGDANNDCRYRDFGLLRYWFRSVERFAPWVNRIFFVTCGQKPDWLNESNPKLRLVRHDEYIPADCLPTFHSNTIELNLHRIPDLSEQFVLFNDDVFLLHPLSPAFFFRGGLPVIPCDLGIPRWLGNTNISRIVLNNSGVLKQCIDVDKAVWRNIGKFTSVRALGFARAAKNIASFAVNRVVIPGTFGHLAHAHLKSTFGEIWRAQPHVLETTSRSRFRSDDCVNHWLACAWDLFSGRFHPANEKRRGLFIMIDEADLPRICGVIRKQTFPQICLNDKISGPELEKCLAEVAEAFEELLPERSSFEK